MIIREGWLLKRGEHIKNWRARYFVLMDDGSFMGFKQKPPLGQYKDPTNNFTVKGCNIVKVDSATHFIFVIKGLRDPNDEIERNFSAGNDHDRDSWCNAIIETAIRLQQADYMNQHQLHTQQQLQQLQLIKTSIDSDSEMIIASSPPISTSSLAATAAAPTATSSTTITHTTSSSSTLSHPSNLLQTNNTTLTSPLASMLNPASTSITSSSNTITSSTNDHLHNQHHHPHHASANVAATNILLQSAATNHVNTTTGTEHLNIGPGSKLEYVQQPKKMSLNDFNPIKLIGRGSWGKVMLSREKSTGFLYAVKILKKHVIIAQNEVGHTLTESRVLRTTNHPFLVALKYSFRDGERLCFVMEFAGGGELFYHLSQERKFSEEKTKFYAAEIVSALGYLHDHDIIYRDLKLENLLLGRDGHIKIADFGLCKDNIRFTDTTRTFCGTPEYLSPEVIEDNNYGRAVDWWSLGVLLYEMMCGILPFNNKTTDCLFREILLKPVTFPATLSEPAKSFLSGLLNKDPMKRLGGGPDDAREIMTHAFFRGLNWQDLMMKKIPPPFVPEISSETDTRYFDRQFTTEPVNLTPIDKQMNHLSEVDASFFTQFSFAAGSHLGHR